MIIKFSIFSGNQLTSLPPCLFLLQLKILLLSGNNLDNLSRDIRQLENCLEELVSLITLLYIPFISI